VIECEPVCKVFSTRDAALLPTTTVPSTLVPSLNVTLPVATPPNFGVTDAFNATDWPKVEGLRLDEAVVVLPAGLTVCGNAEETLELKFESPL